MTNSCSKRKTRKLHRQTRVLHDGYDPHMSVGSLSIPEYDSSTYVAPTAAEAKRSFQVALGLIEETPDNPKELFYARIVNPNTEITEARMCAVEDAESCALFDSGMAAIEATLWTLCNRDDVLLFSEPLYGGTTSLIKQYAEKLGVRCISFTSAKEMNSILNEQPQICQRLKMVFIETPANPTLHLVDIQKCVELAHFFKAVAVVDNTFLSSTGQHPLLLGADLVIYSVTKYHGGHSDLFGGAILGSAEHVDLIKNKRRPTSGNIMHPHTARMLSRSLETYEDRMTRHVKNARPIADFLVSHPKVKRVDYLGHLDPESEQGKIFKKQCLNPGAMISFELKESTEELIFRFLDNLEIFKLAVSLGGTHSLVCHPATTTHLCVPQEDLKRIGMLDLIRISVGLEHPDDLIWDLDQALNQI